MKTILNPDLYHGKRKSKNFFEGWYFKIVDKNNLYKFAFIPGVAYGEKAEHHHSFIQIVNCYDINYNYIKFKVNDFTYNNDNFYISVNKNKFSLDGINLNLNYSYKNAKNNSIKGNIKFKNIEKWPDTFINPGSMGFYNYLLFMECYSQVCILNGSIEGSLNINGTEVDFTGGKVYVEKNWGSSFPKSWLWIQSNNFKNSTVSVTCSLATIPFPIKDFRGFLIGLTINNKFYSFTTINRSKLNLKSLGQDIELITSNNNYKLTLRTRTNKDDFVLCMGPKNGHMVPLVRETLCGKVEIILEETKNKNIIFKGTGESTGIEYGGEMLHILDYN
ncbi:MAG: tocopherol cyclase family protein [Peptostreptococcaceae bacterium]